MTQTLSRPLSRPLTRVPRPILRRAAVLLAAVALVTLDIHLIGPYVDQAATALSHPVLWWAATALAAEIVSLLAAAQLQRGMLKASGSRVRLPTAIGMTYAAYAVSMSLPAGPAVSAGYSFRRLRQLGASPPTAGFTLISSGVLSMLAYGLLAVAGFSLAGGSSGGPFAVVSGVAAGVLLVLLGRALVRHPAFVESAGLHLLRAVNRVLRREPEAGIPELLRSTHLLAAIHPRGRDWAAGLGAALVNWIADFVCLYASCQAVGAHGTTVVVVLLAYLSGTSVSGISLVPGGLGVVDAALILVLVRNGVGAAPAAAAVLLYRVLSFGFGALAGWGAWIGHARSVRRAGTSIRRNDDHHALLRTPPQHPLAEQAPRSVAPSADVPDDGPGETPDTTDGAGPDADHVRLPERSCLVADRDRVVAVARRGRHPAGVRRRGIRPGTGRRVVPSRTAASPGSVTREAP